MTVPFYACGRCHTHWTGLNTAHCNTCHLNFSGAPAFDKHRANGACRTPEDSGLVARDRGGATIYGWPSSDTAWVQARQDE